ncbi:MAG: methylated-DNA--[protein]-cysteine S-methyltransferase [candidate division Zixibacteria bacterium]|nr:methylated-DNA--[protein]-cysteine S-methyltransferase [candidate division Zixibacteria bacterium]MBU1471549.1 methylated-DNA--[protein]-cysteine S-methyltransferase [candidate division Zixibacteria bacterium]MBU2626324.1 methylated-DNA--[protein]-cysteine S-methyltransferase [candidate division Zixibacteria bacterium]
MVSGEIEIAISEMSSPVGQLIVASTSKGLCRIAFGRDPEPGLYTWFEENFPTAVPIKSRSANRVITDALKEYFAGKRKKFDFKLDLIAEGFQRKALLALARVQYGRTVSYGELAAEAGNPRAARAAGTACARNPIAIVIPCHRVIAGDGSLGGYGGGEDHKRFLLKLEGVSI